MKYVFVSHRFFGQVMVESFEFREPQSRRRMTDWINTLVANDIPFWVEHSDDIDHDTGMPLWVEYSVPSPLGIEPN
jgi:hypothetical protein